MRLKLWKKTVLFYIGGQTYMTLEFLWRGRSAGSMFLLGGICFILLGKLGTVKLPTAVKLLLGPSLVTALELAAGLIVNRDYSIWDYRCLPWNFRGQICLPYSLLWVPLSLVAMILYRHLDRRIDFFLELDKMEERT